MVGELLELFNPLGEKTGLVKERNRVYLDGDWHESVSLAVVDEEKILLQRRSNHKRVFPGLLTLTVSGHITSGETASEAISRESLEELGLNLELAKVFFLGRVRGTYSDQTININQFLNTYIWEGRLQPGSYSSVEIAGYEWIEARELSKLVASHSSQLVPSWEQYDLVLSYIRHKTK